MCFFYIYRHQFANSRPVPLPPLGVLSRGLSLHIRRTFFRELGSNVDFAVASLATGVIGVRTVFGVGCCRILVRVAVF
jgi:hypothetical protein